MEGASAHVPVMVAEVMELISPASRKVLLDCTVGLGGHAEAFLSTAPPDARVVGLDVDEDNLRLAKARLQKCAPRVRLFQANFDQVDEVLAEAGLKQVDAVLADLGVASTQLDDPLRGLTFGASGPLDMRLDRRLERTAADLVNELEENELANLIFAYGEEKFSRRIARRIVEARRVKPIEDTRVLAELVVLAYPPQLRRAGRIHPATRTFQALRIAVNDEMGSLERMLAKLPSVLAVGGRAAIISFHSLEDRRVKQSFAAWASTGAAKLLNKKVIVPGEAEIAANARSRSAKLRGIERVA